MYFFSCMKFNGFFSNSFKLECGMYLFEEICSVLDIEPFLSIEYIEGVNR